MYTILFDATLKTIKRGRIPYYDEVHTDTVYQDQEIIDVHDGYGRIHQYKLHKVDEKYFIAERI